MNQTLVGVFDSETHAQQARDELIQAGFPDSAVQLQRESESIGAGGSSTGSTGMATTAPSTTTSAQTDWSMGTSQQHHSGGIGGFFRSLFGLDDNDEDVSMYSEAARRGHCVLTVDVDNDTELERAHEVLQRHNPIDIDEHAAQWRSEGWSSSGVTTGSAVAFGHERQGIDDSSDRSLADETSPNLSSTSGSMTSDALGARSGIGSDISDDRAGATDVQRVPVVQEELQVGKRTVRAGGIRIYSRVRETPVEEQVQLREERAHVERRAVDRPASEADFDQMRDGTIEVRETVEEPVVAKQARVVEEVEIGKDVRERTETVRDTVRRTEVEVEDLGEHATASAAGGTLSPTSDRTTTGLDSDRPMATDSTTRTTRDEDLSTKAARATDKVENAIERGVDKVTGRSTSNKR